MPYPKGGVNIINLTLDAPAAKVQELADKLGRLPGASVKTTYAKR